MFSGCCLRKWYYTDGGHHTENVLSSSPIAPKVKIYLRALIFRLFKVPSAVRNILWVLFLVPRLYVHIKRLSMYPYRKPPKFTEQYIYLYVQIGMYKYVHTHICSHTHTYKYMLLSCGPLNWFHNSLTIVIH